MATERTTEATNTLEQFRVNFNNLVTDIGDVYVGTNKQLNTSANDVVGGYQRNIRWDATLSTNKHSWTAIVFTIIECLKP